MLPPEQITARGTGYLRGVGSEFLVVAAFFLAALASIAVTRTSGHAALLWPGNAMAAALLVRLRSVRWLPTGIGLLLAGVLANLLAANDSLTSAVAMSAVDLVEIGLTAWVLCSVLPLPFPNITFAAGVRMFALLGIGIPALVSLPGGVAVSATMNTSFWPAAANWYTSTAAGAILCAPSIYLYSSKGLRRLLSKPAVAINVGLFAGCLITTYCAIRFVRFPFIVLGVPLIMAAFRVGAFGAALLCEASGLFVTILWAVGVHPLSTAAAAAAGPSPVAGVPFLALAAIMLSPVVVGLAADDRDRAMRALRFNEQRFRQSLQHSPIGIVIRSLGGAWIMTNEVFLKLIGYTQQELGAVGTEDLVHPDEHEDVKRNMQLLLDGALPTYVSDRRYRHRDGSWVWARVAVSLVSDDDGVPLHFIGHVESLEAGRRAERVLAEERERLRTTLRAIGDAVITTDSIGQITYVNAAAESLIGLRLAEISGRRLDEVVVLTNPQSMKTTASMFALCLARGQPARRPERCLLHRPDGSPRYVIDAASPVSDSDGRISGVVVVLQDATAGAERDRELSHRATHDPLTGLTNRFEFERRVGECFERYRHIEHPATLLLIDLDRFKEVNDVGGHAAGDEVLRRVAHALTGTVRDSDTVARLGGDEFAILLAQSDPPRAALIGSKLLRAVTQVTVPWNGVTHTIGASIGAASLNARILTAADWIASADRACYEAKRAGRGQMRITQG